MGSGIILAIVIGCIVGIIIGFLLKSKKSIAVVENNSNTLNTDELKNKIAGLEEEKADLIRKLSNNEQLLKSIKDNRETNNFDGAEELLEENIIVKNQLDAIEKELGSLKINNKKTIAEKTALEEELGLLEKNAKLVSEQKTVLELEKARIAKENEILKDDLEDIEDELEDQKRSNKKIREEKNYLEEELNFAGKNIKVLSEQRAFLEHEKEKIEKNLKETDESLLFINDILNAQNSSNKDFEKLSDDTIGIYKFIEKDVSPLMEHPKDIIKSAWEWRNSELKPWIKGKKKIAIVGEFSAGKTSIINRILSQDNPKAPLLPVSSKETTAIPTYISKSKDFNCQFLSPDNELRNVREETFGMVTKSVLDKVNISNLIKYFVLSYDNKYLDDLSILDTPGFASNSDELVKRTADVVKEADAIFWIIDANTGDINQSSINVMKEHLNKLPLYFIINKSDTKSPNELDLLEAKIKETAANNAIAYKSVIRFSQKEDVAILMSHIKSIETKKEIGLMKYIDESLFLHIKDLEYDKSSLIRDKKSNFESSNTIESNFEIIEREIGYAAEDIKDFVKLKSSWFSSDKYQIDQENYADFQNSIEQIIAYSGEIREHVEFHSESINEKVEINSDLEINKYELEKTNEIQSEFRRLITEYNPNLLN